jgi:hypothetical protein
MGLPSSDLLWLRPCCPAQCKASLRPCFSPSRLIGQFLPSLLNDLGTIWFPQHFKMGPMASLKGQGAPGCPLALTGAAGV